eukprot:1190673-Prorocentrum_minimum.AAC.2
MGLAPTPGIFPLSAARKAGGCDEPGRTAGGYRLLTRACRPRGAPIGRILGGEELKLNETLQRTRTELEARVQEIAELKRSDQRDKKLQHSQSVRVLDTKQVQLQMEVSSDSNMQTDPWGVFRPSRRRIPHRRLL